MEPRKFLAFVNSMIPYIEVPTHSPLGCCPLEVTITQMLAAEYSLMTVVPHLSLVCFIIFAFGCGFPPTLCFSTLYFLILDYNYNKFIIRAQTTHF